MQFAQLQTQHDMSALLVEATVRNRALADRVSDLERELRNTRQELGVLASPQKTLIPA